MKRETIDLAILWPEYEYHRCAAQAQVTRLPAPRQCLRKANPETGFCPEHYRKAMRGQKILVRHHREFYAGAIAGVKAYEEGLPGKTIEEIRQEHGLPARETATHP